MLHKKSDKKEIQKMTLALSEAITARDKVLAQTIQLGLVIHHGITLSDELKEVIESL